MNEKIVNTFVLTLLLLVIVLPRVASIGTVESASYEDFSLQNPSGTSAQQYYSTSSVPPPTGWNQTYGGADADKAYSIVETSDGGYALAGETASYGAGYSDFWLIKTDSSGNMQWNQTYGGLNNDIAHSLIQTADGGYALTGNTKSYGAGNFDFWLVKTDSSGSIQWNQTYGGLNHDLAYSVVQMSDEGYAIAGDTSSYGAGGYDFWLVRTDSTGNMQWNQTYGGANSDIGWSVVQTGDGGYALAGYTASYGVGGYDFWLVKVGAEVGAEIHDIAVTDVAPSKTVVGQGFTLSINVTVTNQGNYSETFNVNAYANTTIIDAPINITLPSGNSTTITFTWDTTSFAYGNYTISAVADTVPGETDTADNTYTNGIIMITIPGDINGDRTVDIYDAGQISAHWHSPPFPDGPLGYDPYADINNDGKINILDVAILNVNWHKSW